MSADSGTAVPGAAPTVADESHQPSAAQRKPRLALFIATAAGLGYMPVAPGTWGSLAGIVLAICSLPFICWLDSAVLGALRSLSQATGLGLDAFPFSGSFLVAQVWFLIALVATAGVWASKLAAEYSRTKDPQFVVIDEVSGQHLALFLGILLPAFGRARQSQWIAAYSGGNGFIIVNLSLKYLLLGFILFRVFDIWKPFPARQAECLPGGWGIMADDWVAGIYAAIGLWIARAAGL
jgi:phosphatidylglycerophosphatase A